MKKILTLIGLMIIVACSVMAMIACENTDWDEGDGDPSLLEFELSEDGTYYSVAGIGEYVGTHLVIPEEHNGLPVKEIGSYAFRYYFDEENEESEDSPLSMLKAVTVADSVTSIGYNAFYLSNIEQINIGCGLGHISEASFESVDNLKNINVCKDNQTFMSKKGVLYSKSGAVLIKYPSQKKATRFRISNKVKTIEKYAFEDTVNLKNVKIGKNVTTVGEFAFRFSDINKVKIPNSVQALGAGAFYSCENLREVKIGNGLTEILPMTFFCCERLERIVIPKSIKAIRGGAFSQSNLTEVFYEGNQDEWNKVKLDTAVLPVVMIYEDVFPDFSQIYCYSKDRPSDEGNYWHNVFWTPTVWKR
ncbi:MAG: leucine-rich repeat domain-containing protein [Clostridiales bacterium]|nr:leucine-rich repeat domain-containing protein [Clostridiales bacterium]